MENMEEISQVVANELGNKLHKRKACGFTKFRQSFAKGGISMGKVEECKYCKPNSINYALGYDLDGEGSSLCCRRGWLQYVDEYEEEIFIIKINYCPMCGRKLEV